MTTSTLVSPYGACKIVNKWLADKNIVKELPPQMFYTYTKANKKGKTYIPVTEDRKIKIEDLQSWFTAYFNKNFVTQVTEVEIVEDENQLELFQDDDNVEA
jgi:hypothetical protein